MRSCPGCHSALQIFHARSVEIDRCFFCGGFWFDKGELERASGKKTTQQLLGGTTLRACAAGCSQPLVPAQVRHIEADVCTGCQGVFVEGEAMDALAGALPLQRPPSDPMSRHSGERLMFDCAGCGAELALAEGMTTGRGVACARCYPALDATPSTLTASPRRRREQPMALGDLGALLWSVFDFFA